MVEIKEKLTFNQFDSKGLGMYLIDRELESPKEKKVLVDIPYRQSVEDFSMITGERIFEQRQLKYEFKAFQLEYSERKELENECRRLLMSHDYSKVKDTHDRDFYWWGKCEEVSIQDDAPLRRLTVQITFKVYPFLIGDEEQLLDIWDRFDFEHGIAQFYDFDVKGARDVILINNGSRATTPTIKSSETMKVQVNGVTYDLRKGDNLVSKLKLGVNRLRFTGSGYVQVFPRLEVLV